MGKIVAVNASPRTKFNTGSLVREAARGAESQGAQVQTFDLARLDKHSGCMSCFACKLAPNEGTCVFKDGLAPVLSAIREADGLVIGTPNYLGDATAEFKALLEQLVFQRLTYRREPRFYDFRRIPVLFVMTSNASVDAYNDFGYNEMVDRYKGTLETMVGDTKTLIVGETMQVKNYGRYNWDLFDGEARSKRHEDVFPHELEHAFQLGSEMASNPW